MMGMHKSDIMVNCMHCKNMRYMVRSCMVDKCKHMGLDTGKELVMLMLVQPLKRVQQMQLIDGYEILPESFFNPKWMKLLPAENWKKSLKEDKKFE